jgi:PIN domain nuclease of toxin-antitoxin system
MNKIVLDASALLAVLNGEAGSERLTPDLLSAAACSTVNLAEVQAKLVSRSVPPGTAWKMVLTPVAGHVAFTAQHAQIAGSLIARTRALGLSLGDRACLALAISLRAPVYTADRAWKKLLLKIPIHVIR